MKINQERRKKELLSNKIILSKEIDAAIEGILNPIKKSKKEI